MLRGMTRIAFIGAGSIEFTRERLDTAEAMARWTAEQLGGSPTFSTHLDRREALAGADFAVNMIQVGGHAATLLDFEIPARHGLRQTIADTLGIGGIFRALRTADHMLALGREMAVLCPSAWLLNYTNPMAMLCWLVYGGTPTRNVVGLCHSVQFTTEDMAELVGVPAEEVAFLAAGLNHQAF